MKYKTSLKYNDVHYLHYLYIVMVRIIKCVCL